MLVHPFVTPSLCLIKCSFKSAGSRFYILVGSRSAAFNLCHYDNAAFAETKHFHAYL